jgi:hypothetical protein
MQVELTTKVPVTDALMSDAGKNAHQMLSQWLQEEDLASNNEKRGAGWVKT